MSLVDNNTTELVKLSNKTLDAIPASIKRPSYDRGALTPGIVHIGLGNFHRAHQSWYLHRLMEQGDAHDWAIVGAGVRPYDQAMREKLVAQDGMSTLIELDPDGTSIEIVGSMIDYIPIVEGNGPLIDKMADPAIRIVALTVTEGGYYFDPATLAFDTDHPDIQHDAANPDTPRTAFGAMVAALKRRRDQGHGPFTCQSCDNLQGNGQLLRQTVVSLARLSDGDLADWINTECTFPNSMVDCIVPATGPKEIELAKELGIDDQSPVSHENYRQWVIEDSFCAGRPDWDKVGATFSDRVHDYETMKIRILNAGHQVIANAGELLSVDSIAGCMAHPLIGPYFLRVENEDIAPTVEDVPGMTADAYVQLIHRRFSNPKIIDTTRRVAFDGSSRHTGFVLPILRDALKNEGSVQGLALVEAVWARMCEGHREDGSTIEPNDPFWDQRNRVAIAAKDTPRAWLEQRELYGDLIDEARFVDAFETWLEMIWKDGLEATLKTYLSA